MHRSVHLRNPHDLNSEAHNALCSESSACNLFFCLIYFCLDVLLSSLSVLVKLAHNMAIQRNLLSKDEVVLSLIHI